MKRLIYYFVTLFSAAMVSCTAEVGFGLSIQPEDDFLQTNSGNVYVSSGTEKCDSVLAKSDYFYLGQYADELFGITRAEFMTQIDGRLGSVQLPDTTVSSSATVSGINFSILSALDDRYGDIKSITNGRDVTVDSVLFYIQYDSNYVGDSTALQSIKLYELNKTLPGMNASFSNMRVEEYCDKSKLLGSATYRICGDKIIKIKLDDEYAKDLMSIYVNKSVSTQEQFCNLYKGFYVSHSFNEGAIIQCTSIGLQIFYSFDADIHTSYDGRDTVVTGKSIKVNGKPTNPLVSSFLLTANKSVNQANLFSHPDLDEKLKQLLSLPYTYVYTPAGLYTNVAVPFDEIKKNIAKTVGESNLSNVMFNSAKLKFPVKKINWKTNLSKNPNTYLMMIKKDQIVDFFYNNKIPNAMESFVGVYDTASASYSFDVSYAAQRCLNGDNEMFKDLVLLPVAAKAINGTSYFKQMLSTSVLRLHSSDAEKTEERPCIDFVYTLRP